jgi:hypothetical protein
MSFVKQQDVCEREHDRGRHHGTKNRNKSSDANLMA